MKKLFSVAAAVIAIAALVALVGCASSTPTPATTTPSTSTSPASGSSSSAGPAAEVSIVNMAFAPEKVTIQVGDTVKWTNNDSVPHTVTGADFDSGPLAQGATYEHTFGAAGTFDYKCTIHPQMLAQVLVQ